MSITQVSVGKLESKHVSRPLPWSSCLVAKRGVMVPGIPGIVQGNWGWECLHFMWMLWLTQRRYRSFSEWLDPGIIMLESLLDKQSWCLFTQDDKGAIYEFEPRQHRQQTNHDAETNNPMLKKTKNLHKQELEDEANNMQLDKKEDTRQSNLKGKKL